ncbi:MAG: ribosome maturation factor RimM [Spirochaetales bacterium]|uniref:Ribosome maturation factor RimM n=1 Tax=Candidatus Thalassospirochaeta sargassi TaxID=3119039 RepID=A0AAJ1MI23_9SPIO|nr:ribosome maturation factor RimM [Spirochaetales bacterium]
MNKLAIGKVRTSVGVRGYFKVLSFSGEAAHFKKLKGQVVEIRLNSRTRHLAVEDVKMSGSNITMKVAGIDSPEEAKKLSGWELFVERNKAAELKKDEFYLADLCKCKLVFNGETVGNVKGVSGNAVSDLLEVDLDGKIRLIPFLNRYIGDVDIKNGTIELLEGWLLE